MNELIGNPAFREYISYVPEHVYMDDTGDARIYDEMWTGDWWWETQVSLRSNIDMRLNFQVITTGQTSHWGDDRPRNPRF